MLNIFAIAFRLRKTYRTNGFIYFLKTIPLIKKIFPDSLYSIGGLKSFANVISIIAEIASMFFGKFIYMMIIFGLSYVLKAPSQNVYVHLLIFFTIIGGIFYTQLFNPTKDKFYAITIMGIDARLFTLSNYVYFLLRLIVGMLPFSLLTSLLVGAGIFPGLIAPFFVVGVKVISSAWALRNYNKRKNVKNENKLQWKQWIILVVLLLAAFLPGAFGYSLTPIIFYVATVLVVVIGYFSFKVIWSFDEYRKVYKKLLKPENLPMLSPKQTAGTTQKMMMQKKISIDTNLSSNKSGYKFFNELFMKRHSKILTKTAKKITIGALIVLSSAIVANYWFPEVKKAINDMVLTFIPYFLFVMYLINRGPVLTRAMFMNCDHGMLSYGFYRQPKTILLLFVERLKYVILINLLPAIVIALGLPILLFVSGGTSEPLNYLFLFVSVIAMSVLFSVHHIVIYYLLQPYNVDLESKNVLYSVVNFITYMICYVAIGKKVPTLIFGSVVTGVSVLYIFVALILIYRLAPKTFRLK